MRIEEPGSRNPVEHFLDRGETPFVRVAVEAKEIEDLEVRVCEADTRRIGDVSLVVKQLMYPVYQ